MSTITRQLSSPSHLQGLVGPSHLPTFSKCRDLVRAEPATDEHGGCRVFIAAEDEKAVSCGSVVRRFHLPENVADTGADAFFQLFEHDLRSASLELTR